MISIFLYLLLGLVAGTMSGLIGIGGGEIITLALLVPPIGLLAAWTYYKQGYVDVKIAGLVCIGFFLGGLLGAKIATELSGLALERVFGIALLLIAIKMILT